MGVGFCLTARYRSSEYGQSGEDWLDQLAAWLEGHEEEPLMFCRQGSGDDDQPTLFVHVHPSAEEVEFTVPEPGLLAVSAKTSTVGPGYHAFLCDLLDRFSRHFHVEWDEPDEEAGTGDETGYFFSRDLASLKTEMLRWLSAIALVVTEKDFAEESQIRMVSMPLGYSYPDEDAIVTPLGPRVCDWFAFVARDANRGREFFAWWEPGPGCGFFLGRALCRMWQDVRWRTPVSEDEGELLMDVHLDLERAYRLEHEAALPWREWAEIVEYLGEYFGYVEFQDGDDLEETIRTRGRRILGGPRIGYRRGTVQVSLTGGWSIRVPGDFAEEWETSGQAWSAWHAGRTVRFTSWSVRDEGEQQSAAEILAELELPDGDVFEHQQGNVVGRAVFFLHEEKGESLWNLKAYSAVVGGFALCNIFVRGEDDLGWALDVWKTLEH
jgi:hypothetical protein